MVSAGRSPTAAGAPLPPQPLAGVGAAAQEAGKSWKKRAGNARAGSYSSPSCNPEEQQSHLHVTFNFSKNFPNFISLYAALIISL